MKKRAICLPNPACNFLSRYLFQPRFNRLRYQDRLSLTRRSIQNESGRSLLLNAHPLAQTRLIVSDFLMWCWTVDCPSRSNASKPTTTPPSAPPVHLASRRPVHCSSPYPARMPRSKQRSREKSQDRRRGVPSREVVCKSQGTGPQAEMMREGAQPVTPSSCAQRQDACRAS